MNYASVAAALLVLATPCVAQVAVQDPLVMTTDPADRAVMAEASSAISSRKPDIARLDAVLAKLSRPTPLRGMVQTVRAYVLANSNTSALAVAAVEDALRLLPDDPRPKIVATNIFTFAGSPQRAADLWIAASRESPDYARSIDRYSMMALLGRLNDMGDRVRADRLSARLNEIGFSSGLAPERSAAALARTREALRARREGDALPDVTAISNPRDLLTLYVDRQYTVLWPRITEWGGPDLTAQSRRYLEELRSDWSASNDFETAAPYAAKLFSLNASAAVVALFLPMFDGIRPGSELVGVERLAPVVARALGVLDRYGEARALLAKVSAVRPEDGSGNELNIDGAYVTLALMQKDWPQVVLRSEAFLVRGKALGDSINRSAMIQLQAWRACALSRTGRVDDGQQAAAEVVRFQAVLPDPVMDMHVCRGDVAAARAHVIERLADETTREWALGFVQPVRSTINTPLEAMMKPVEQAVRTAPDVVAAANRVGRILPSPVESALPPGFDPFRTPPATRLVPGGI